MEYDFTDKLSATVEARYMRESKKRYEPPTAPRQRSMIAKIEFKKFTPRLTRDYKVTDDFLLYGVLSQGVKPGGLNGRDGIATGRPEYHPGNIRQHRSRRKDRLV
jgi:iron complex outermembrane recepter protein